MPSILAVASWTLQSDTVAFLAAPSATPEPVMPSSEIVYL
jgi:hypothetical protein